MAVKVAVVTGSNKGIGFGIVKNLCSQFDGIVYLCSRDVERGLKAVEKLKKEGLNPAFHQLDITEPKSVETFAEYLSKKYGGIDILVCNAAIFLHDNVDNFGENAELTIKTNYFGFRNTTKGLVPLLRPHARVVVVSSDLGHLPRIPGEEIRRQLTDPNLTEDTIDRLMLEFVACAKDGTYAEKGWPFFTYVVSKVGASALARVYHQKFLKDPREDIVINHVHPGFVATDMSEYKGPLTIAQGADAPTYLALLPANCTSPKGDYIWFTREILDWVNGPLPNVEGL